LVRKEAIAPRETEDEFLALLNDAAGTTRIAEAAETLRLAHIRALKEKRQSLAPSEKNAAIYGKIEAAIRQWTELPEDAIIEAYRDPNRRKKMPLAAR
jgi:hypothetical protein